MVEFDSPRWLTFEKAKTNHLFRRSSVRGLRFESRATSVCGVTELLRFLKDEDRSKGRCKNCLRSEGLE